MKKRKQRIKKIQAQTYRIPGALPVRPLLLGSRS